MELMVWWWPTTLPDVCEDLNVPKVTAVKSSDQLDGSRLVLRPVAMQPSWLKSEPPPAPMRRCLPYAGRPSTLCWDEVRFECPDRGCEMMSWTWDDPRIAPARQALTDRAGRWVNLQVGHNGRPVADVAKELGCS